MVENGFDLDRSVSSGTLVPPLSFCCRWYALKLFKGWEGFMQPSVPAYPAPSSGIYCPWRLVSWQTKSR